MSGPVAQQLFDIGERIVQEMEARRPNLEAELLGMEKRQAAIERELHATKLARERLVHFAYKIGPDYQCIRCWVTNEKRTSLSPIPSNTKDNLFRCDDCGLPVRIVPSM